MHNKNLISLLYLIINCISTKSATHKLSLKDKYILHFLNFSKIDLCGSSANFGSQNLN